MSTTLDAVKNFAKVIVSTGYAAGVTSIALTSGHGAKLPDPSTDGEFNLVWWNFTDYADPADDPNVEIIRCTTRSTDTLTVTRAQESTSDSNKNTSNKTYKMILAVTAKMISDIGDQVDNITPTGAINGSNKVYTLPSTPNPASSLDVRLAGMYMTADGEDYTLVGDTMTYVNAPYSVPHRASYRK